MPMRGELAVAAARSNRVTASPTIWVIIGFCAVGSVLSIYIAGQIPMLSSQLLFG